MPRLASGIRLFAVACCAAPAIAVAEPAGNLPIDPFRPAIDSRGYLTINASQPLGHGEVSFGLGALSWGRGLLALEDGANHYTVDDVVTATLVAAVGVRLGPAELEFGASLPLSILAGDRGPDDPGMPNDANDDRDFRLDGQGIGNAGLHVKTRFSRADRGLGVGAIASVFLPTASPSHRFMGDAVAVPQLLGIVDKELVGGRLRLALNGGVRLRSTTAFVDTGDMGAPPTNQRIAASAELPFGGAAAWALAPGRFDLVAEVFGSVPLDDHANYQPLEVLGGAKLYLARNSFLSLGAGRGLLPARGANPDVRAFIGIVFEPSIGDGDGDGVKDGDDKCPAEPEDRDRFADADGCPDPDNDVDLIVDGDDRCPNIPEDRDGYQDDDGCPEGNPNDRDGDGILDRDDKCPDDPEDFDGFEDADGCPDLDNDRDRILDRDDLCPSEPETYNNVADTDGCPDPERSPFVEVNSVMTPLTPIGFEYDSDVIQRDSYYILDAVAAAIRGNDFKLVEIAGHTDERGNDAYNLDLSNRRAASVMRYLIDKGIDPARLDARGYGETRPVDKRHTQAAYTRNRRVEFVIVKR